MSEIDATTFEIEARRAGDNLSPVRAGLLLARECAYPSLRPSDYLIQLEELASKAEAGLRGCETAEARSLGLAQFLFKTAGFRGNLADYGDPRNSYLNQVLERRLGLPITLSVIFLEAARQLGIPASGVGMPGHFIVSVLGVDGPVYLDPFNGGQQLTVADCAALAAKAGALEQDARFDPLWLSPTPPRAIVARMLNNLRGFYLSVEDWPMAIRVVERLGVLQPAVDTHVRDLGLLHYRNGAIGRASELLNEYLRRSPAAPDADAVRQGRDRFRQELARLN
jgi:regulator of sirC expression with transglutaminase-like and TPR domain